MNEALPHNIEGLLRDLQVDSIGPRKRAIEELGQVSASSLQIVRALIAVEDSDPSFVMREMASESLRAPAHQETLQQYRHIQAQKLRDDSVVEERLRSTGTILIATIFGAVIGAFGLVMSLIEPILAGLPLGTIIAD